MPIQQPSQTHARARRADEEHCSLTAYEELPATADLQADWTWTFRGQSFVEITQSDAVQLVWLPGSGPKKVAKLNHMFNQSFHMGVAGDALPTATVSSASASTSTSVNAATSAPTVATQHSSSRGGSTSEDDSAGSASRRMAVDVVWEIEFDLNSPIS